MFWIKTAHSCVQLCLTWLWAMVRTKASIGFIVKQWGQGTVLSIEVNSLTCEELTQQRKLCPAGSGSPSPVLTLRFRATWKWQVEKPIAGESGFSSAPFVMCREVWENCWSKDQVLQTCVLLKCSDSSIPAPGAINVICHREINSECSLSETVAVVSPASRRWKYCFRHEIMKLHTSLLKTKQTVLLLLCGQWWKMIESPGRQLVSWVEKEHPAVVGR